MDYGTCNIYIMILFAYIYIHMGYFGSYSYPKDFCRVCTEFDSGEMFWVGAKPSPEFLLFAASSFKLFLSAYVSDSVTIQ